MTMNDQACQTCTWQATLAVTMHSLGLAARRLPASVPIVPLQMQSCSNQVWWFGGLTLQTLTPHKTLLPRVALNQLRHPQASR